MSIRGQKRWLIKGWVLCWAGLWVGCQTKTDAPVLTIAVSANFQYVMDSLVAGFEAETGIACRTVAGASGNLTAQVREGAPFDVFVSADMRFPQALYAEGLAADSPRAYARGRLVLWTLYPDRVQTLSDLRRPDVQHIALANPETAPYGRAAVEVLEKQGLMQEVEHKLVFGESVTQASQFILSQSAEAGFTALSVVLTPQMRSKGSWIEVDTAGYSSILQGVVVLKGTARQEALARRFQAWLLSPGVGRQLTRWGYFSIP